LNFQKAYTKFGIFQKNFGDCVNGDYSSYPHAWERVFGIIMSL